MNSSNIVSKINSTTSKINLTPVTQLALSTSGAAIIMDDVNDKILENERIMSTHTSKNQESLNLWQFSKLYKIGNIPIIDFFICYVVLYMFNCLYNFCDHKITLIATIPIVLIFNLITNPFVETSPLILIVIFLTSLYVFYTFNN